MKQLSRKMQRLHEIQISRSFRTETGRLIVITEKEREDRTSGKDTNGQGQG